MQVLNDGSLQFKCPHCGRMMRVAARFLGQRGKCNACGGRVMLDGRDAPEVVQEAKALAPEGDTLESYSHGMLQELWEALARGGEERPARHDLLVEGIREMLREEEGAPPSERQRATLKRLGLPAEAVDEVRTEARATTLGEEAYLQPTYVQRRAMQTLGLSGAAMATAKTRAHARLLIEGALRG